jgi:dihydroflavonol-4-reductase
MRVLITGGTGFLGLHLCRRMVADGHDVRALVRPTSDCSKLADASVETVTGDVTDRESLERAARDREWVVHAAANLADWGRTGGLQMKVNVDGTRLIAQVCRTLGVKRLLHVSSVAAIGIPNDAMHPANEDFPFNLEDSGLTYHCSKRRAEEAVMAEVARGLDAVIVNPASVKGPHGSQYRGAEILRTVSRARIVPYFTGGICVVHVHDVVEGILAALERGVSGQRYILGGENLTFRALAERAARVIGVQRRFIPFPPTLTRVAWLTLEPWARMRNRRPWITYAVHHCASRPQFYDSSKARATLQYAPRSFDAILDECIGLGA